LAQERFVPINFLTLRTLVQSLVSAMSGADDIDAAIKQVDELNGKLDDSEKLIKNMLAKAAPVVVIPMPKLKPSMFGGTDEEQVPLLADVSKPTTGPAAKAGVSKAKLKAEALRKKTEAAKQKAEQAQQEMADEAKKAMDQASGKGKQIAAQMSAAAASIAIGVSCSFAPLDPMMGQILAGVAAAVINFLGLAASWKSRAGSTFQLINKVFDKIMKKVTDILDNVDDMIMGPLEKLENAIDDMADEQKPTLDKMKQFESAMKMADPSFNLPDPADLQKPLDGCDDMIDDFVDKAKKEIPDKLMEMIQSNFTGKLATDEGQFNLYVVNLPLLAVLLVNIVLAVAQVAIMFKAPESDSADAKTGGDRQLRGSSSADGAPLHASLPKGLNASLPMGIELPAGMDVNSLMPYIQPALVQIALAGLQLVAAMVFSSGPRICNMVNAGIASFGEKVNERVNFRIKTAVDKVFGEAFKMVKGKSDEFFPKFKDATTKLKEVMETAGKAAAAAKALADGANKLAGMAGMDIPKVEVPKVSVPW